MSQEKPLSVLARVIYKKCQRPFDDWKVDLFRGVLGVILGEGVCDRGELGLEKIFEEKS